jgi:hypothetical protein
MTFQSTFSPALRYNATSASRDYFGEQKHWFSFSSSQVFMFSNFVIIWNLFVHKVHPLEITEIYKNNYKLKKTHGLCHFSIGFSFKDCWFQSPQFSNKSKH